MSKFLVLTQEEASKYMEIAKIEHPTERELTEEDFPLRPSICYTSCNVKFEKCLFYKEGILYTMWYNKDLRNITALEARISKVVQIEEEYCFEPVCELGEETVSLSAREVAELIRGSQIYSEILLDYQRIPSVVGHKVFRRQKEQGWQIVFCLDPDARKEILYEFLVTNEEIETSMYEEKIAHRVEFVCNISQTESRY